MDSARHAPGGAWVQLIVLFMPEVLSMKTSLLQLNSVGGQI